MRAVELWTSIYGAETGNLALKCLAAGGVYLAGGVSARLAAILAKGLPARGKKRGASPFLDAFLDKGRMRPLLEKTPVADRAVGATHVIHWGMGWGDGAVLRFHERFAAD